MRVARIVWLRSMPPTIPQGDAPRKPDHRAHRRLTPQDVARDCEAYGCRRCVDRVAPCSGSCNLAAYIGSLPFEIRRRG